MSTMSFWFWQRGSENSPPAAAAIIRSPFIDALHVFVLASFAVAQPIYDRLSGRAALFVDQSMGMPVAYLLVALISVGLPTLIVLIEGLVRYGSPRCYEALHRVVICVFLLLVAVPICKQFIFLFPTAVVVGAIVAAVIGTRLYLKYRTIRTMVTWAALGIVIFPLIFLVQFSSNFTRISPSSHRTDRWSPVPVVFLVFDEFCGSSLMTPEREIDAQRFPNFAALARDTTWFRNATSVNQSTSQALPAILSGCYPATSHYPVTANLPQNLFSELVTMAGYDLVAFEPVSGLAPPGVETNPNPPQGVWSQAAFVSNYLWRVYLFHVTPSEYQKYLPEIPKLWFGMHDSMNIDATRRRGVFRYNWTGTRDFQFQHFLNCLDGADKPTLYFMHFLLPHLPWCYLPSGSRYAIDGEDWQLLSVGSEETLPGTWGQDELEMVNNQQRYLLQLMYVDKLLGKFIARLKETGLYDRSLLIVTADHGISFRSNLPRRGTVTENADEILSVPMFIKLPGQKTGGSNDQTVESVDLFPTVADVVGLSLERPTDGWSVFDRVRPQRTKKTFGDYQELQTVDPAVISKSIIPLIIRERFGDSTDPQSLYETHQIPELIGRRSDSLTLATTAPLEMEILRFGDTVTTTGTKTVPCLYEGQLPSKRTSAAPMVIAVSVNGTIQAVTRTYRIAGAPSRQWSAMVPELAFHEGKNDVRIYKVTGTQPDWVLTPCLLVPPAES